MNESEFTKLMEKQRIMKESIKNKKIKFDQAVKTLEDMGYVLNIWHIEDVTHHYRCSDSEARVILESVLESDYMTNKVVEEVDEKAFDNNFKRWEEVHGDEV